MRSVVLRSLVALALFAIVAGCAAAPSPTVDPYPLPAEPPNSWDGNPVVIGTAVPTVVLYLTPRPGDRIELVSAEAVGVAAGADVEFLYSPPVLKPNGDHVIGERLLELRGATFSNATATAGPDSTVGIVARITPHQAGRFQLTNVRLHYRLNGGAEQVGQGIDVVFTVCADVQVPASCDP